MTQLFERAIAEASQLPEAEQDAIAQLVLDEIESDCNWDAVLAKSPEKLWRLADEAWAEHEAGGSEELDPPHPSPPLCTGRERRCPQINADI